MASNLKLEHERRKVALRGALLTERARVAASRAKQERIRTELKSMQTPRKTLKI